MKIPVLSPFYESLTPGSRGIVLMLAAAFCFAAMHALIRFMTQELHPFEVAFFRNFFGMIILVPIFIREGPKILRTNRISFHIARGLLQVVAMLSFFYALSITPLATVSALGFSAPLFTSVFAIFILGEVIRTRRIVALIAGFVGTLIIVQPGSEMFDVGSLLVVGSSAVWAVAMIIIKIQSRTESSVTITMYMALIVTPLSLIPALFVWEMPSLESIAWMMLLGTFGTLGHLALTQAFRHADATAVLPFDFTRLIWASIFGFILFAEVPGIWAWVGGIIIFTATTYIAYREARVAKTKRPVTAERMEN
jgi:drug/metabolite transporter (DMT)-like permease